MKKQFTAAVLALLCFVYACTKASNRFSNAFSPLPEASSKAPNKWPGRNTARLSGDHYSKPIPVDTANLMIQRYLNGVGYPYVDTAIRSLYFDADTLRAYLENSEIRTVKLMLAHPLDYVNSDPTGGSSSLNAGAMSLVIVGLNNEEEYVLNSSNGVYDNMLLCPNTCPGSSGALIQ